MIREKCDEIVLEAGKERLEKQKKTKELENLDLRLKLESIRQSQFHTVQRKERKVKHNSVQAEHNNMQQPDSLKELQPPLSPSSELDEETSRFLEIEDCFRKTKLNNRISKRKPRGRLVRRRRWNSVTQTVQDEWEQPSNTSLSDQETHSQDNYRKTPKTVTRLSKRYPWSHVYSTVNKQAFMKQQQQHEKWLNSPRGRDSTAAAFN